MVGSAPHESGRTADACPPRGIGDFAPTAPWPMLHLRARLLRQLRGFFDTRGFLEVETPVLSADTVIDRHLDPFTLTLFDDPRQPQHGPTMYLQTSPEFHMKRMMAAGAEAIYQVARVFRGAECGPWHNPEFTLVEWYRRGDHLQAAMDLLDALAQTLLGQPASERVTYADVFDHHVGVNPLTASLEQLVMAARRCGYSATNDPHSPTDDLGALRDDSLHFLFAECVQPHLGTERPAIVSDFPASQAALAQIRPSPPAVAERFELFVRGIELANGYHELRDGTELERRQSVINQQRQADGKQPLPNHSRLLTAMQQGLPPCAGVAIGFDRWVMIASGATCLSEVIAFPISRA